ncbi:MAG: 4a-hydroxytetrahydrobiopterin dehydratase [Nitrospinota bacterium]
MTNPDETCNLSEKKCKPCEGGTLPLGEEKARDFMRNIPGWELSKDSIQKEFKFKDHYQTIAFVNAVAWVSHAEDHHPGLEIGYNTCRITYSTHAIGGLSENDFICAAKVDIL